MKVAAGVLFTAGIGLSLSACEGGEGAPAASAAQEGEAVRLPRLRPGRWLSVAMTGGGIDDPEETCVGPDYDLAERFGIERSRACKRQLRREGDHYAIAATCSNPLATVALNGTIDGDFRNVLTAVLRLEVTPAGQPGEVIEIALESRYQGPCTRRIGILP